MLHATDVDEICQNIDEVFEIVEFGNTLKIEDKSKSNAYQNSAR